MSLIEFIRETPPAYTVVALSVVFIIMSRFLFSGSRRG